MIWTVLNLISTLLFAPPSFPAHINSDVEIISISPQASSMDFLAEKGAVLALDQRGFFFTQKADEVQPIASITKLMTALVFLDNNPGWENIYEITNRDNVVGGRINLFFGEKMTIKDLFYTSLIASDNGATVALMHSTGLSEEEFTGKMNEKARRMGLSKTSFVDTSGLSDMNVSTAREVAWMAKVAFSQEDIAKVISSKDYSFKTVQGMDKFIESTDFLLFDTEKTSFEVLGGKTGYTDGAGYCFVGRFRNNDGREVISVVLNSSSLNERFRESKKIVNWVLDNYRW